MRRSRTGAAGRIARWVLLSCTLLGLVLMHTIGHTGGHAGKHDGPAAVPIAAGAPASVVRSVIAPEHCPAGHCDSNDHGATRGWSVCLAVLGGLLAVALLAALLARAVSRGGARSTAGRARSPRGPPRPAGLAVASLAVLRI